MSHIVATENLTKKYGERTVVENINLRIPPGCVYGFLGPNGSGKSTTMKMLLSLIEPTSGQVEVMGQPMTRHSRRRLLGHIGSLIEAPPGYTHLTGAENMRITQRLLGLNSQQVDRAIHTVRMREQLDKKVGEYSLGMKQRLGIAMALARQPDLLVLDEPTNGLDPSGIEEIRDLLRRLTDDGVTVMISSHLLGEIDKTADMLGILSGGQMIFQGTREQLSDATAPDVLVDCDDSRRAATVLSDFDGRIVSERQIRVPGLDDPHTAAIIDTLVRERIAIYEVRRDEHSLEDLFRDLTAGGGL